MKKLGKKVLLSLLICGLLSGILPVGFKMSVKASPDLTTTSLTIGGAQCLDVDTGDVGPSTPDTDLWWEQVSSTERYLVPQNGATVANLGIVDFDSVVDCSIYTLSTDPINGSIGNNTIPDGTVLVIKTDIGNCAKMRIDNYGVDMDVTIVYQDDGSPIVNWAARVYGVEMLWNNSMAVNDLAVSKEGDYVVAVNNTGIYYFESNNSNPKWWYLQPGTSFKSAMMSADGEYVVSGDNDGYVYYFNNSLATTDQRSAPTWKCIDLWGPVERGTLDMSDDGEYITVGGTGVKLYYFAECSGRSSLSEPPTWSNVFSITDFLAVHMSSDGRYVAAGGADYPSGGFVMFYKDAYETPYPSEPSWNSRTPINSTIKDLAVSDDGYSVVAVDATSKTLYYWANANTLSGDPDATWTNDWAFDYVDMSADGEEIVTGTQPLFPCGLHFWANAKLRSGPDQEEDWTKLEGEIILDVVMSDDGSIIAAAGQIGVDSIYKAYFFKSDGNMIGEFDLLHPSPVVSISGNGNTVAMGGPTFYSLHVFKMITDTTPPEIENVYQEPANDIVYPDDEVTVYANITDNLSGVKQVTLNYTTNNETWFSVNATNLSENVWNATIPAFLYCTDVTYVIKAEDNATTSSQLKEWNMTLNITLFQSFRHSSYYHYS